MVGGCMCVDVTREQLRWTCQGPRASQRDVRDGWLRQGSSWGQGTAGSSWGGRTQLAPHLLYEDWRDGEPLPGGSAKHMLPKVIDQFAGAEDVDGGEVVGAGGVVVVAVDGEDGQPHVEVGVHIVGKPMRARGGAGLYRKSAGGAETSTILKLSGCLPLRQQARRPVPPCPQGVLCCALPYPACPHGPTRPRSWRPGH